MSRRIAIADLGSNTLKLSVTDVASNGAQHILDVAAHTVRLSAGVAETGFIEPVRIDRAMEALQEYELRAREMGAVAFRGVATAAVRMASNGSVFIDRIKRETAWRVNVITGQDEAHLTFLGLVGELPARGTCIIADIGGASTELIRVIDREPVLTQSVQIGSGTLADRTFRADPPGKDAVDTARLSALAILRDEPALAVSDAAALFLAGGNGVFLSRAAAWNRIQLPFVPQFMPLLVDRLAEIPARDLAAHLGIVEERARMLPAGGGIGMALVELVQPGSLVAVPSGIRGGLVHQWIESGRPADEVSTSQAGGE